MLVKWTTLSFVSPTWINGLLNSAANGNMADEQLTHFLSLSAQRKDDEFTSRPLSHDHGHFQGVGIELRLLTGTTTSESPSPEHVLFSTVFKSIKVRSEQENGWEDEAIYGGLVAIRDICRLESLHPEVGFLQVLSGAMEKTKPSHVRQAAYDIVLAAQDWWLRLPNLRPTLEGLDFPRRLHNVGTETCRPDHRLSFLGTIEILSEDRNWRPYLRGAVDIWLPSRDQEAVVHRK